MIAESEPSVLLMGRDVTDRIEAEELLRQSEERLRVAIASSPVTIYQQDLDLRYTYLVNVPAPVKTLIAPGMKSTDIAPDVADELDETKREVIRTRRGVRKVIQATGPLKGCFYDLTVEPMVNRDGELVGVTCAAVDVTASKQAEAELESSRTRYRAIFESVTDGLLICRPDGAIVEANSSICSMLHNAREGLLEKNFRDVLLGAELPTFEEMLGNTEAGQPASVIFQHQTADGDLLDFELRVREFEFGGAKHVLALVRDLTVRMRAIRALEARELELRTVLESLPISVFLLGSEGEIVYANPATERLWGGVHLVGPENYGLYEAFNVQTGEKVDPSEYSAHAAIREGKSSIGELYRIKRNDGDTRIIIHSVIPIRAGERITGAVMVHQDITELKATEDALQLVEKEYQTIFREAQDGFLICGIDGLISEVNPSGLTLLGVSEDALSEGLSIHHVFGAGHEDLIRATLESTRDGGKAQFVALCTRKWGAPIPLECSASLLTSTEEPKFLVVMRDITERVRAEEARLALNQELERRVNERTQKLLEANQELESFSYSVSHDLRSPLRSMNGFSKALLDDYGHLLDEDGKDYLNRIMKAANRMGQLIDDLLKLASVGRSELRRSRIDFTALAEEVAEQLKLAEGREISFEVQPNMIIHGDPVLLRVVLENLMGNSVKFTSRRERPVVKVGQRSTEKGDAFFVEDNGEGFDQEYAGSLFQPFQRLHGAKDFPGTGIGLASVRRIVNRHGGETWAEGRLGEGATIYFSL